MANRRPFDARYRSHQIRKDSVAKRDFARKNSVRQPPDVRPDRKHQGGPVFALAERLSRPMDTSRLSPVEIPAHRRTMEMIAAMQVGTPHKSASGSSSPPARVTRRLDGEHSCALGHAVRERLQQSPYRALQSIGCNVHDRTVTLTGCVRSYFLKQMAQHLVGELEGIERVRNELSVA